MQVPEARLKVLHYVLETERDEFHREWVPENLRGVTLKEAYHRSKEHIFISAVISIFGVKMYKDTVKLRWEEINKGGGNDPE